MSTPVEPDALPETAERMLAVLTERGPRPLTIRSLAHECGYAKSTAQTALRRLREAGLVRVSEAPGGGLVVKVVQR